MSANRDDISNPSLHPTRRARTLLVAAPLLLSAVLLAPSATHASCGSYIALHPSSEHSIQPSLILPSVEQAPLPIPSDAPRPCFGPACSNRPLVPAAPALPSFHPLQEGAIGTAVYTLAADTSSAPLADNTPPLHSPQQPRSIFRPPRLAPHAL